MPMQRAIYAAELWWSEDPSPANTSPLSSSRTWVTARIEMSGIETLDPVELFNTATLSIHVPPTPIPDSSFPSPTTLKAIKEGELDEKLTDSWIASVLASQEREETYYDESLPFYLTLHLPSHPSITRLQAASLLLPSIPSASAHLTLSADLSYVEGQPTSASQTHHARPVPTLSDPPRRRGHMPTSSSSGPKAPPATLASRLTSLSIGMEGGPKVPVTPSPFPATRASDVDFVESVGVPVWNYAFEVGGEEQGERRRRVSSNDLNGGANGSTKDKNDGRGRVWVGRDGGEKGRGGWVGVWEFRGDVAFVRSDLLRPKVCLTVSLTFRDDPRLVEVLERTRAKRMSVGALGPEPAEDDEYLVESFDDVNLLEGLDDTYALHLPASRLPLPELSEQQKRDSLTHRRSSSLVSISRRDSLNSHRRSLSIAGGGGGAPLPSSSATSDAPLYPSVRRAFRRVLDVKSVLSVRMRTVPCPVFGFARSWGVRRTWDEVRLEENEGQGMAMCVEVSSIGHIADTLGFLIESVEIEVSGGSAGSGDVEVKPLDADQGGEESSQLPVLLHPTDQHNFIYALSYAGHQDDYSATFESLPPPIPIHVAGSPSQRFNAKMGDFDAGHLSGSDYSQGGVKSADISWARNVGIIVRGRPVKLLGRKDLSNPKILATPYSLPEAAPGVLSTHSGSVRAGHSPTSNFAQRWNCTLDISAFALPVHSKHATFLPSTTIAPHLVHQQPPLARLSLNSPLPNRTPKDRNSVESIVAGSKRHTIANLSALALKSPALSRGGSGKKSRPTSLPRQSSDFSKAPVPFTTELQTPGATGPPRRFFSLPPGAVEVPSRSSTPAPSSPVILHDPVPPPKLSTDAIPPPLPTPAFPPHSSARPNFAVVESIAKAPGMARTSSEAKRESWTAQSGTIVDVTLKSSTGSQAKGIANGPGLGLSFEGHTSLRGHGSLLVSVALMPLRDFKPDGAPMPVGLLDVFLVEVFVVNRGDQIKRFTVGVPPKRGEDEVVVNEESRVATIIPLENDVRIGPLAPRTCASVRLRFLAVRPGAHTLQELRLVDQATGFETRLREPLQVVVENR
ncbi:hypothetical protein T439DRAFT_354775 [Meredithblackwellia eburnea MCA 4105]